jgi:pimeloyl-ACP methyl ester carboxylesterase
VGEERALTIRVRAAQLVLAAALLAPALAGAAAPCEALAALRIPRFEILAARPVTAGQYESDAGESYDVPAMCRVRAAARPVAGSLIHVEVWMPELGWNGRYYQLGTGGFGGTIHAPSLAAEVRRGNAAASTDTGHTGTQFDASWARGHPQRIIDYGYRSIGVTSDAARAILRAYYGKEASRRYFAGCSNGGRQALMAAERFPEDWDGILAGSPATPWIGHVAGFAEIQQTLRRDEDSWLPATKLPAVQRAALERRSPVCADADNVACLTKPQAQSLAVIVRHGYDPTTATYAGGWAEWIVNDAPGAKTQLTFAEEFFRHMVFEDPRWTVSNYRKNDRQRAERKVVNGETLHDVLDPSGDLRELRRRNGKLVMYLGSADPVLTPRAIRDYYRRAAQRIGNLDSTRTFVRLFEVPGMIHCQGGPSPNAFGQAYVAPALRDDAQHDIRRALEAWAERGIAPERIVAAKYVDDDPKRGVAATRTLCAYPKRADCAEKEEGEHERT